jgi:hypothetical protein
MSLRSVLNIFKRRGKDNKILSNEERATLFFDEYVFNPVIEYSKNKFIRIIILALQKFNYYCSKYKIYQGEDNYKQLCNEVNTIIKKYNLPETFFIEYDPYLEIYRLNRTITNNEKIDEYLDEYRKFYVDQKKYFTKYEWENIVYFFIAIIEFAELNKNAQEQKKQDETELNEFIKLEQNKRHLENELEEDLEEDRENEIISELEKIDSELKKKVIERIERDEKNTSIWNEDLDKYGGRKNKNKKKTKRRRTKKRKTKRRKIL